jgi:hypothetical protein
VLNMIGTRVNSVRPDVKKLLFAILVLCLAWRGRDGIRISEYRHTVVVVNRSYLAPSGASHDASWPHGYGPARATAAP